MDYFDDLPPELIALLPSSLSTASLNALALTCRRLHEILQPELEARITPELAHELLRGAAASKPHIVRKILSPPHSIKPTGYGYFSETPLHIAAKAGNIETTTLLLEAGADPGAQWDQEEYQALHLAAMNKDLEMMKLLLDHDAPVDGWFGCDGCSETALHLACSMGNMEMIHLLLERGADIERTGHYGNALGFAVHRRRLDVVRLLLGKGADASVTVPLFILLDGGPALPHKANLLYIAMDLCHPLGRYGRRRKVVPARPVGPKWEGLPLGENRKQLMAMLMAHGARKETTLETISQYLAELATAAGHTEKEYLGVVEGMLKEAEDAAAGNQVVDVQQ
ncbi:ankyrin repeat-containing domain protein [Mycena epipterygia]|nr:ankyrin repeat-containing domain protein [Mycena epipterygia]